MFTKSILIFWITNNFCTSTMSVTDKQLSSINGAYSGTQTDCLLNYISSAFINVQEVENQIAFNKLRTNNFFYVLMNVKDPQVLKPSAVQATVELNPWIQTVEGK